MTDLRHEYDPRPLQREIHRKLKRFSVLVCHRRFGKTVLAINQLIASALKCTKPKPRYAYFAPFRNQAKNVAWDYLQDYTRSLKAEFNQAELRADLPNGARITLYGADNPNAIRGIGLDGCIMDEHSQMPPRLWDEVVRPCLADREGYAIFIGTPMGENTFHKLYTDAIDDDDWYAGMFKASETGVLPDKELEAMRVTMSPDLYKQELECSFTAAVIGAYYGVLMREAEDDGRISAVPHDDACLVQTSWDLGIRDSTAIWAWQFVARELHLINYHEAANENFAKSIGKSVSELTACRNH